MEEVEELDLKEILEAFWNKKWIVIILMIIGAVFGFIYTKYLVEPKYTSSVTLILSKPVNADESQNSDLSITQSDISLNQKLISTYGEIIKSRKVLEQVINNLSLDMDYDSLFKCFSTNAVEDTDVVKVSVTTNSPTKSASIANEAVNVFSGEVVKIYNIKNVSIIDEGQADYEPVNVNMAKNIIVFALLFFTIGVAIVFAIYYFDNTIKSKEEIEKYLGVPVLAIIPKIENQKEEIKDVTGR